VYRQTIFRELQRDGWNITGSPGELILKIQENNQKKYSRKKSILEDSIHHHSEYKNKKPSR